ncbi:DUF2147 domain-containing protein [Tropicimonas sp. TH_r6]|uniref:DUF2147 domain-containing protein n=1 Tax=Tropicimonas sp. TH_r6 TaxID=3082085 RepID=UPI002953DF75|nr:DUF2147 domain-containing protein [Tropicimonas sp. TH_r6]MDV7143119.1 DUF2147 domain-containing protein [Tropicimonas sp. TH_r6]
MKKLALAAALVCFGSIATADPILGTWKTQPGDDGNFAHVTLTSCGSAICGTIGKAFNGAGKSVSSDTVGKRMVWDMTASGGGKYSGGKIWAPDRDKTYKSKMALSGNSLKVSGCVGPICRSQTWTRVN